MFKVNICRVAKFEENVENPIRLELGKAEKNLALQTSRERINTVKRKCVPLNTVFKSIFVVFNRK